MYKYLQSIFVKQDANCSVRRPKKKFEPRPGTLPVHCIYVTLVPSRDARVLFTLLCVI